VARYSCTTQLTRTCHKTAPTITNTIKPMKVRAHPHSSGNVKFSCQSKFIAPPARDSTAHEKPRHLGLMKRVPLDLDPGRRSRKKRNRERNPHCRCTATAPELLPPNCGLGPRRPPGLSYSWFIAESSSFGYGGFVRFRSHFHLHAHAESL
jgi:hypothetical protein